MSIDDELSLESTRKEATEFTEYKTCRVKTEMERNFLEVDKPEYMTFLTALDSALPVEFHGFTSQGSQICRKTSLLKEETCKWCNEDDRWSKTTPKAKNKASNGLAIAVYNFNAEGRKKTIKDKDGNPKKNKEGKEVVYESKPVQCLLLKRGSDDANLVSLREYDEEGALMDGVWELRKHPKEAKKTLVPTVTERKMTEKRFKRSLEVPQDVKKRWANMPKEEARGFLANQFDLYDDNAPDRLFALTIKPQALDGEAQEANTEVAMDG
jgi:hypothetical protein